MPTVTRRAPITRASYDALVFDLDGTLLDGAGQVSAAARAQLTRARSMGFLVFLATGRSVEGSREIHADLGLDTEVVAYNGAWIGHPGGTAPWHYAAIPDDLVPHLHPVEARAAFHFRHQRGSKFTRRTAHPEHPKVMGWFRNVVPVEAEFGALPHDDLLRVSLFYGTREVCDEGWHALSDDARARLHREVFPMSLFPEFVGVDLVLTEIQRRGRGKAEALRLLAERYGVPAARVVAFGDQHNDLPLLREVGLPVAMGNAIPQAKEVAHHVIAPHTDDGVARFLADHLR
jgi:Cof subfamily protein (haloacid dehalogenase superfamily)